MILFADFRSLYLYGHWAFIRAENFVCCIVIQVYSKLVPTALLYSDRQCKDVGLSLHVLFAILTYILLYFSLNNPGI